MESKASLWRISFKPIILFAPSLISVLSGGLFFHLRFWAKLQLQGQQKLDQHFNSSRLEQPVSRILSSLGINSLSGWRKFLQCFIWRTSYKYQMCEVEKFGSLSCCSCTYVTMSAPACMHAHACVFVCVCISQITCYNPLGLYLKTS